MAKANESTGVIEPQMALMVPEKPSTPMEMLAVAVSRGAGIDELGKLMDLQERYERNEARKAFVVAMNSFKANPPAVTKNKQVSFGNGDRATTYSHATLDHVCEAVTKALSEHAISHRWKVEQADQLIKVTCILTHELGHSEETTLMGSPDTSGSKNSIQAIGSTVTYLQRYTLLAATGLAASNTDNDGNGGEETNGDLSLQLNYIASASTPAELAKLYAVAYEMFEDKPAALKQVIQARKDRKAERCW